MTCGSSALAIHPPTPLDRQPIPPLVRPSPYKVILLEGGGFEYDDSVQELYRGTTTGQRYYPLRSTRLHQFGGTTGLWGGFCSPLDPIDFEEREWVPGSGWPITERDLLPFYHRAHEYLDLGPYDYTAARWQRENPGFVPLPLNEEEVPDSGGPVAATFRPREGLNEGEPVPGGGG